MPWGAAGSSFAIAEHWLRLATMIVGLAVGIATFVSILRGMRRDKLKRERETLELCESCMRGHAPRECPLAWSERPDNCPKRKVTNL